MDPQVKPFFDPSTWTVSYIVYDKKCGSAAIIDSVLDYDPKSGRTATHSADLLISFIHEQNLTVDWILETHAHADHLSAAQYLKQQLGGLTAIGGKICQVQEVFKKLFNMEPEFAVDGSQFDYLFQPDEIFHIGALKARVISVPGHTPADVAYHIGDTIFVGDTLFMPDVGTARCDFPGGSAAVLYQSIQRLLSLPEQTRLFMCHDYPPDGRTPAWETTVAMQRRHNIHMHDGVSEADFVAMRGARDRGLDMPVLILPSVQINIRAGHFPPAESNGVQYLKIPLNQL